MAEIIMYTDLHIDADRVDLYKVIDTMKWINELARVRGIKYKFNLGDTFDFYNHTKSKMKITPEFMSMMYTIGEYFEDHDILRGNHEFHEEGDLISIFEMFGARPILEPTVKEIDGKRILLMPYFDDISLDKLDFSFANEKFDYVFGHCDISGASFESGFKEQGKDSKVLNKITFDKMYIGHYHIKQQIRSNIWSIGSTQSRVKTDNPARMGITILNTETGETEFIENPFAEYNPSDTVKVIGTQYVASKKYNLLDEIENFKLEKTGLEAIIDYTKNKRGVYDDTIIDYTIEYLESLKS